MYVYNQHTHKEIVLLSLRCMSLSHCPTGTMAHRTLLQHQQATELLTWTSGATIPHTAMGAVFICKVTHDTKCSHISDSLTSEACKYISRFLVNCGQKVVLFLTHGFIAALFFWSMWRWVQRAQHPVELRSMNQGRSSECMQWPSSATQTEANPGGLSVDLSFAVLCAQLASFEIGGLKMGDSKIQPMIIIFQAISISFDYHHYETNEIWCYFGTSWSHGANQEFVRDQSQNWIRSNEPAGGWHSISANLGTWGPPDESTMKHKKLHETSIKMTQDIPRCGLSASHFPRGPPLGRTPMQADWLWFPEAVAFSSSYLDWRYGMPLVIYKWSV